MSSAAEDFARLDTEQARKRIAHIARAFRRAVEQEIGRGWLANRIVDVREIVQTLRARDDHVQLQGGELGLLNAMVQSYCFGTSANFDDRVNDTIDLVRKFAPPDSDAYPLPRAPPPPGILRPDHAVTKSASGASGSSLEYAPLLIKVGPPRKRPAFEMGRPSQSGGQGQHHDVAAHQGKAHANADLNGPIQTTTPQRPLNTGSLKSQHAAPLIKVGPPRKVTTAQRAPNTLPQSSQPQQTSHPNPPPLASPSDSTFSESSSNRQPPVGKRDAKQTSHTNPPPLASPSDSTCSESSFHRRSRIGKRDADDEDYIADLHSAIDESSTLRRSGRKPAPARRLSPDKRASMSAPHSDRDEEMDSTDMPPKKKTKRPDKRSTAPPATKKLGVPVDSPCSRCLAANSVCRENLYPGKTACQRCYEKRQGCSLSSPNVRMDRLEERMRRLEEGQRKLLEGVVWIQEALDVLGKMGMKTASLSGHVTLARLNGALGDLRPTSTSEVPLAIEVVTDERVVHRDTRDAAADPRPPATSLITQQDPDAPLDPPNTQRPPQPVLEGVSQPSGASQVALPPHSKLPPLCSNSLREGPAAAPGVTVPSMTQHESRDPLAAVQGQPLSPRPPLSSHIPLHTPSLSLQVPPSTSQQGDGVHTIDTNGTASHIPLHTSSPPLQAHRPTLQDVSSESSTLPTTPPDVSVPVSQQGDDVHDIDMSSTLPHIPSHVPSLSLEAPHPTLPSTSLSAPSGQPDAPLSPRSPPDDVDSTTSEGHDVETHDASPTSELSTPPNSPKPPPAPRRSNRAKNNGAVNLARKKK